MRAAREHKRKSGGRRRAVIALAAAALCAFAGILCLAGLEPPMDNADGAAPTAFFCHVSGNYAARQTDGKCAAYASAYVLRHLGEQADGEGIYPEIKRTLGFAAPGNVAELFQTRGYCAQAYMAASTLSGSGCVPVCRSSPLWPFPTTRTMLWWWATTRTTCIWPIPLLPRERRITGSSP